MPARKPKPAGPAASPGDSYTLSGDFRGATVNIQSTIVGAEQVRELEQLPPEDGDPPYLGLTAFGEKDAARFFGREKLTARLAARLAGASFLAVIGDSGSGKSSLVRAGLVPALRRGEALEDGVQPPPNSALWQTRVLTPTTHPLQALAAALLPADGPLAAAGELEKELGAHPETLGLAVRRLLAAADSPRLLLVVDQFEELFSQCRQEDERLAFTTALCAALDSAQPLTLVIVLRADFYARLAQYDRLRELTAQNQEFIGAMSRDELFRAIVTPAALGDWKIQQGLVELMLDDAGAEPGALPLLSHALLETWRRRRARTMTLSGYGESGGVRGAIARTAEAVFTQRLTADQRPVARLIFTRLAELDEDALDTRRRASFSELITRSTDPATISLVLNILTEARLVTTGTQEPGSVQTVEVAHEALIREWPTLRGWLDEDRAGLILHQRLADNTRDWLRLRKDPGELYRGQRLEQALAWAQQNPVLVSLDEQGFLDASRQAQAEIEARELAYKRSALLRRLVAPGLAVAILGILAILFFSSGLNNLFKTPARMDGVYNIAVAEFTRDLGQPWQGGGALVSGWVASSLSKELSAQTNFLVWRDGPELRQKNVTIGKVEGSDPAARAAAAQAIAARLNAQVVVFGDMDSSQNPPRLRLEFWIAPQADYHFEEIWGSYQTETEILIADPAQPGLEAQPEVERQASTLAWTALGLARMRFGQTGDALEAFRRAETFAPGLDSLQFFIGRESLFLSDRQPQNQEQLLLDAETAFKKALAANPAYANATKALGSTYVGQAQRLIALVQEGNGGEAELRQAAQWVDQSLALYRQAAVMPPSPSDAGVAVAPTARLGEGIALRIRAEIEYRSGDPAAALASLKESQAILEELIPQFTLGGSSASERSLIQTHQALGTVWQWRGFLAEVAGDAPGAEAAYRAALNHYDTCLAMGQASLDRIVRDDIATTLCQPFQAQVKEKLFTLEGGPG